MLQTEMSSHMFGLLLHSHSASGSPNQMIPIHPPARQPLAVNRQGN